MATINFTKPSVLTRNYHYNYLLPYHQVVKILNDRIGNIKTRYNDTVSAIQSQVLLKCKNESRRLRVKGSKWSLSRAPYGRDYIADVSSLNITLPLGATDVHNGSQTSLDNLIFVQSGKKIESITNTLEARGKSLKASGASNGQTISGAIATGVHGSAIDAGSVQDSVCGLHIITSDQQSIYVERASDPTLSDSFAASINATVIRDDDIFNSALVSIGGFGFIIGVAIKVEDVYLLERHIVNLSPAKALFYGQQLDFSNSNDLPRPGVRPYHFQLYLNPYNLNQDYVAKILYKMPFQAHQSPVPVLKSSYFGDLPSMLSKIVNNFGSATPMIANALSNVLLPSANDAVKVGTLGEIFHKTSTRGSVFSYSFAIPTSDLQMVLNALMTTVANNKVPGLISVRFVEQTKATIGFTKFSKTAVVEVDGIRWNGLPQFLQLMTGLLNGTPSLDFAFHWGKNSDWSSSLVNRMYGSKVNDWKNDRNSVLNADYRAVFDSDHLQNLGLT